MMHLADFEFVQLTKDTPLLPFVSEDEDLNNFLTEDATPPDALRQRLRGPLKIIGWEPDQNSLRKAQNR